jgi:hypothetical protein
MTDTSQDLSSGHLDDLKRQFSQGELREENERRTWKTRMLWAMSALVVGFYGLFIYLVWFYHCRELDQSHLVLLIVLAAIPSLLCVNIFRLVGSPTHGREKPEVTLHPWLDLAKELGREAIDILKKKSG